MLAGQVRSFECDMVMFETVAEMGDRFSLAVCSAPPADRPDTMPLCHLVDMHTYRGVGHLGPSLGGKTFAARFKLIFDRVTGSNPRLKRCESPSFEADKLVEQTRFAQRLILRFALKVPATPLSAPPGGAAAAVLTLRIDSGVLAAAVGPIAVKVKAADGKTRELLVMLGVRCAEDDSGAACCAAPYAACDANTARESRGRYLAPGVVREYIISSCAARRVP